MSIGPTTMLAINNFGDKPIENMPTIGIPGIGTDTQAKLAQKGIVTALHLYNKLKELQFDEQRLRVFMEVRCKITKPRVTAIHAVLTRWHKQFGDTQRCDSDSTRAEKPPAQSMGGRGVRRAAAATKRPRSNSDDSGVGVQRARTEGPPARAAGRGRGGNGSTPPAARKSVQFSSHECEPISNNSSQIDLSDDDNLNNVRYHSSHPLVQCIASLSTAFEKIPENIHSRFRNDILDLVEKYESQASTST